MTEYEWKVREAADRAKREILADIAAGVQPARPQTFGDLHDHVDANEYGGLCDEPYPFGVTADEWAQWGIDVQEVVNDWIVAGLKPLPPTVEVTPDHYEVVAGMADGTSRLYRVIAADEDAAIAHVVTLYAADDNCQSVTVKGHRTALTTRYEVA